MVDLDVTPRPLAVRPATLDDADAIAALVHLAYRSDESRQGWTTELELVGGQRTDPAMVASMVEDPEGLVLVSPDAEGLLACCHLQRRVGGGYLGMFAVRPGRQGNGVGRRMLVAAERWVVREWGAHRLELTVLGQRPELIAWYERRGFVLTGELHDFPYGDERFGTPHRPDLVLLEMAKTLSEVQE